MEIYNTLTKRKEEFKPLEPGKVKMYVCGPTVYNYIHIGNARPMIVFDTVRRYMEYKGYDVNYVSNFTDVDDKIIKKANEEGVEASVISERFIKECKQDMAAMNVKPATTHPLATQEIDGMIDMISTLIEKGHAYEKNGTVYFRTASFKDYGKLSHKNLDDLQSGFRDLKVSGEEDKESPLDFVLWKPKKEGEPYWESPWSEGRPGWHIECSVMSKKYLGEQIDIHAGGEDLIFPHHENEIAQSEACNGKEFSHYWMHNAFLNIDNRKMSKSLGNFLLVRDIEKKYDLQVLRFFMLSAHYRSPLNFSAELMEAAKTNPNLMNVVEGKETLDEFVDKLPTEALIHLLGGQPNTGVANTFGMGNLPEYGIPNIMTADGPAGLRIQPQCGVNTTAWPCATLLACTWDPELIEEIGKAGGEEVKENNIGIWLTPAVNIHRSPLCGRNFEYYSEDPLVAGKSGAAMVRGMQSEHIGASVKHFCCNNKETNRKDSDSRVSERALREIYLKAFEIIVKEADPYTIMSSYNLINGVQASENKDLLTGILRGEWDFKGMVTTDWWTHGEHYRETKAGNDIKMANGYEERVQEAFEKGYITRDEIALCAKRILTMILRMD